MSLRFAGTQKVAETADDLTSPNRLPGRFVDRFLHHGECFAVGLVVEQIARALTIARDGGQRLVELVRQR